MPYSLYIEEYQEPEDTNKFHIICIKTLKVLESGLSQEEFNLVKDNWKSRILEFEINERIII